MWFASWWNAINAAVGLVVVAVRVERAVVVDVVVFVVVVVVVAVVVVVIARVWRVLVPYVCLAHVLSCL